MFFSVVEVSKNGSHEEVQFQAPGYDVDLKYYNKVYPTPKTTTAFNVDEYNEDVSKRISEAMLTFTTEATTQQMDESGGDGDVTVVYARSRARRGLA